MQCSEREWFNAIWCSHLSMAFFCAAILLQHDMAAPKITHFPLYIADKYQTAFKRVIHIMNASLLVVNDRNVQEEENEWNKPHPSHVAKSWRKKCTHSCSKTLNQQNQFNACNVFVYSLLSLLCAQIHLNSMTLSLVIYEN